MGKQSSLLLLQMVTDNQAARYTHILSLSPWTKHPTLNRSEVRGYRIANKKVVALLLLDHKTVMLRSSMGHAKSLNKDSSE